MIFYEVKGAIGEGWTAELIEEAYIGDSALGSGSVFGAMGDLLFDAVKGEHVVGQGTVVWCNTTSPTWRVVHVEGGGTYYEPLPPRPTQPGEPWTSAPSVSHERAWEVWRLASPNSPVVPKSDLEMEQLRNRVDYLEETIAKWEVQNALEPHGEMRYVGGLKEELVQVQVEIASQGTLFVAFYLGFGRRVGENMYLLMGVGPLGVKGWPQFGSRLVHFVGTTDHGLCGIHRALAEMVQNVEEWWAMVGGTRCPRCSAKLISSGRGPVASEGV